MRSAAPPLVLLASPSAEVRRRWSQALQGAAVIQEVAERSELERSMATRQPALVLLDLSLPPLDGVGVVPALQRLSARAFISPTDVVRAWCPHLQTLTLPSRPSNLGP